MIRRITGSAALGKDQLDTSATCPQCDHPAGSPEALELTSLCPLSEWRPEALHACWFGCRHRGHTADGRDNYPKELHLGGEERAQT